MRCQRSKTALMLPAFLNPVFAVPEFLVYVAESRVEQNRRSGAGVPETDVLLPEFSPPMPDSPSLVSLILMLLLPVFPKPKFPPPVL